VPVRCLAVEDAARARDAGEADVDDAGRPLDVEADAEAEQEHRRDRECPCRPHGPESGRAAAHAHPQAAREEVAEDGVHERDAPEDLPPAEEGERDGEAEEREQVDVAERERTPEISEAEQEDEAETEPDERVQERLPPEAAVVAARHLPGDLRPGPRLRDPSGRVLDDDLRDLAGRPRPRLDDPGPRLLAKRRRRRGFRRIAVEPRCDLRVGERDPLHVGLVQARGLGPRDRRELRRRRVQRSGERESDSRDGDRNGESEEVS
jgi:hypothetical protein